MAGIHTIQSYAAHTGKTALTDDQLYMLERLKIKFGMSDFDEVDDKGKPVLDGDGKAITSKEFDDEKCAPLRAFFHHFVRRIGVDNFVHDLKISLLLDNTTGKKLDEIDLLHTVFQLSKKETPTGLKIKNNSSIQISSTGIEFKKSLGSHFTGGFTESDAVSMAAVAAFNKNMLGKEVVLTGNKKERALLEKAINSLNEGLADNLKIKIRETAPNPTLRERIFNIASGGNSTQEQASGVTAAPSAPAA